MDAGENSLLEVKDLKVTFRTRRRAVEAVRKVSFSLRESETLAIVGESGSGKTVTALSLTGLLPPPPSCQAHGSVLFRGKDLLRASPGELRRVRGKEIAYIFQEPSTSLNPLFTVENQIAEAVRLHLPEIKNVRRHVIESLDMVGIRQPHLRCRDYPHQLSGGMQQRVMIAMALACRPRVLVADEPTTALDVTIQKQIMDLLKDLRSRLKMAIILITHNFGIVSGFAQHVAVMFRGEIVERGPAEAVLRNPQHLYTRALLACVPRIGARQKRLKTIDYTQLETVKDG